MAEDSKIVERLSAACYGHPHAKIPWPHRLLYEAANRIKELEAENQSLRLQARAAATAGYARGIEEVAKEIEEEIAGYVNGERVVPFGIPADPESAQHRTITEGHVAKIRALKEKAHG